MLEFHPFLTVVEKELLTKTLSLHETLDPTRPNAFTQTSTHRNRVLTS